MPATRRVNRDSTSRPSAFFVLEAQELLARGDARRAVELCKRGLTHYPGNPTGYVVLALAYLSLGEKERGLNVLRDGHRRTGSVRLRDLALEVSGDHPAGLSHAATPETILEEAAIEAWPETGDSDEIELRAAVEELVAIPVAEAEPVVEAEPVIEEPVAGTEPAIEEPVAAPAVEEPPIIVAEPVVEEVQDEVPDVEAAPAVEESPIIAAEPIAEEVQDEVPDIEAEPVIEEPIAEAETVIEESPIIAADPVIEEAPEVESEPIIEEPVAEAEAVIEESLIEPETKEEPVEEAEPIVGETPDVESEPIIEADPVPDIQPAAETEPIAEEEIIQEDEFITAAEPAIEEEHGIEDEHIATADLLAGPEHSDARAVIELASSIAAEAAEEPDLTLFPDEAPDAANLHEESLSATSRQPGVMPFNTAQRTPATDTGRTLQMPLRAIEGRTAADPDTSRQAGQQDRGRPLALHLGKNITRLRSSNLRLIPGLEFAPLRHEDHLHRQSIAPLINEPMPMPMAESSVRSRRAQEEMLMPPLPMLGSQANNAEDEDDIAISGQTMMMEDLPELSDEAIGQFSAAILLEEPVRQNPPEQEEFTGNILKMVQAGRIEAELTPLEELARRLENARIPVVQEVEPRTSFEPSIVSETLANILEAQGAYSEALKAFQTLARMKPERFDHFQRKIRELKWRIQNPNRPSPME